MYMDIKGKVEELVEKIKSDKQLQSQFTKDPVAAIEKLIGIDLPDEQIKAIADGVKAKISLDKLGGLFKK